jgi:hypothetical protein
MLAGLHAIGGVQEDDIRFELFDLRPECTDLLFGFTAPTRRDEEGVGEARLLQPSFFLLQLLRQCEELTLFLFRELAVSE